LLFSRIVYNANTLSFLTNYRPNFCSECGAKIVRLRWRVWTSRRFCDECCARLGKQWLQRVFLITGLVIFGMLIGRGFKRESPPLVIQRPAPAQSTTSSEPAATVEETYICGARTKKGTPCSRRVRGPVRCWQHKGAKAMLPVDKLVVKE